jgi:hypothetical protein
MFIGLAALLAILALLFAVYGIVKNSAVYVGTGTLLVAVSILLIVGGRVMT